MFKPVPVEVKQDLTKDDVRVINLYRLLAHAVDLPKENHFFMLFDGEKTQKGAFSLGFFG